jgi:putative transposase
MVWVDQRLKQTPSGGLRMQDTKRKGKSKEAKTGRIIRIEQEQLTNHLDKVVRSTVEETLNALLDAEADRLCQAGRYERTSVRKDTRAGHYNRKLATIPFPAN